MIETHHESRSRPLRQRNIFQGSGRFGPNMTPMVDVVLVILIFFMAASTIAGQEWFLSTDLPEQRDEGVVGQRFALPTPMLDLELYVEGEQVLVRGLGDEALAIDTVVGRINAMDPTLSDGLVLRIGARDEVPYGSIVALHDAGSAKNMRVAIR
jgi:biopolymer transport protein ExbD